MRLINADDLIEEIKNSPLIDFTDDDIIKLINIVPTINFAVPINIKKLTAEEKEILIKGFTKNRFTTFELYDERPQGEWEESHIFSCGKILRMRMDVIEHKRKNCGWWSIKWVRTIPDNFCSYCGASIKEAKKNDK